MLIENTLKDILHKVLTDKKKIELCNRIMKSNNNLNRSLFGISIIIMLLWILNAVIIYFIGETWQERGTMGDMFGASNALFSGLAFAGLLYTIFLQREDIKNQREDIKLNRASLAKSVELQAASEKALQAQVEQMHLTAKLNAMNTVINYYNYQIADPHAAPEKVEKARNKRREIIKQIDELIEGLHDSEID